MKNRNKISIQSIVAFFAIMLGMHYYLSYIWLRGISKIWGIEKLSIISREDLLFNFVEPNLFIMFLTSLCLLVFAISESISNRIIENLSTKLKKRDLIISIIIFLFILVSILTYILYPQSFGESSIKIYFTILFLIPILYFRFPMNKNIILGIELFLLAFWATFFIKSTLRNMDTNENNLKSKANISFKLKSQTVKTSKSLKLLYHGYKFLIVCDTNNVIDLYPSNLIEKITYQKK